MSSVKPVGDTIQKEESPWVKAEFEASIQEAERELEPKYVRFVGAAASLVPYELVRTAMKYGVIPSGVIDTRRYREAFREIPSGRDGEKTIRCVVAKQKNGDYSVIY